MKELGQRKYVVANNAWGRETRVWHQPFEVTQEDVGRTREHYLGYLHTTYTFTEKDVGRVIVVMTDDKGWTCWSFQNMNR